MSTDAPRASSGPRPRPSRVRQRALGFLLLVAVAFAAQRWGRTDAVLSDSARARRWYRDLAAGKLASTGSTRRFLTLCAVASSDELRFIDGASTSAATALRRQNGSSRTRSWASSISPSTTRRTRSSSRASCSRGSISASSRSSTRRRIRASTPSLRLTAQRLLVGSRAAVECAALRGDVWTAVRVGRQSRCVGALHSHSSSHPDVDEFLDFHDFPGLDDRVEAQSDSAPSYDYVAHRFLRSPRYARASAVVVQRASFCHFGAKDRLVRPHIVASQIIRTTHDPGYEVRQKMRSRCIRPTDAGRSCCTRPASTDTSRSRRADIARCCCGTSLRPRASSRSSSTRWARCARAPRHR